MAQIRLVCWNEDLAAERARLLKKAGFDVDASPFHGGGMIGRLKQNPPSLMLIDLDRMPSHGHAVGAMLRSSKSVCHIPLVFVGGAAEKIARVKEALSDANFADWTKVVPAIRKALKNPPKNPVKTIPHMQMFSASSLAKKLGFAPNVKAALLGAEEGFSELLGDLPEGAELQSRIAADTKMTLWFVRSRRELEAAFETASTRMPQGCSFWIIYPKQAGRYKVDFNQNDVRLTGIEVGMVDYKICAVDSDWSGMKFARRRQPQHKRASR